MIQCWAYSVRNMIRLSGFIFFEEDTPNATLVHSAAIIIWKVGLYESGNDDIIMMLKQVSKRVKTILVRLSQLSSVGKNVGGNSGNSR